MMDFNRRDFLKGTAWMGLAATCCLCELTEKSVRNRSRTYDFASPD